MDCLKWEIERNMQAVEVFGVWEPKIWRAMASNRIVLRVYFDLLRSYLDISFYFIFQFALKFNSFHWNERIRVRARPQPMPLIRPTVQISTHSHINKPNWINQFFSMLLLFGCSAARVRQRERGVNDVVHSLQFSSWRWLTMTMGNDEMPQAKNVSLTPSSAYLLNISCCVRCVALSCLHLKLMKLLLDRMRELL